jgi:flotillin
VGIAVRVTCFTSRTLTSTNFSFRTQTVESARADAERVRLTGAAEARAIEAVGRAEAEKMRMKASAYKQYGDAAIMSLVLEALPQVRYKR